MDRRNFFRRFSKLAMVPMVLPHIKLNKDAFAKVPETGTSKVKGKPKTIKHTQILIGGVDYSDVCRSLEISSEITQQDIDVTILDFPATKDFKGLPTLPLTEINMELYLNSKSLKNLIEETPYNMFVPIQMILNGVIYSFKATRTHYAVSAEPDSAVMLNITYTVAGPVEGNLIIHEN